MNQSPSAPVQGLPAVYLIDDAYYEHAKEKIYFKTWQFACHSSEVAKPGDYFTLSIFDQDIFIIRNQLGQLSAFYNVCQHRGHKLLQGKGNKTRVVCPYHAWSYDLDGRLVAAPNSQSVSGFDAKKIAIPSIRLEEFLGFVFINLDENCLSMDDCYPGVKSGILSLCEDVEMRVLAHRHFADEGCNWFTAIENYNECYHCKVAHPDFAKGIIDPNSYSIAPFGEGKVLRHRSSPSQSAEAWYDVSGSDYGSFFLWPASAIQIYPGGVVNSYHWRPLAVDDVRVFRGWYSDDGKINACLQKVIDLDKETTFAEDLVLVKNVQRGLHSRGYTPGPLIVDPKGGIDNERSIAVLQQWLKEALE